MCCVLSSLGADLGLITSLSVHRVRTRPACRPPGPRAWPEPAARLPGSSRWTGQPIPGPCHPFHVSPVPAGGPSDTHSPGHLQPEQLLGTGPGDQAFPTGAHPAPVAGGRGQGRGSDPDMKLMAASPCPPHPRPPGGSPSLVGFRAGLESSSWILLPGTEFLFCTFRN